MKTIIIFMSLFLLPYVGFSEKSFDSTQISWEESSEFSRNQNWLSAKNKIEKTIPTFIKKELQKRKQVLIPIFSDEKPSTNRQSFPQENLMQANCNGPSGCFYDTYKNHIVLPKTSASLEVNEEKIVNEALKGVFQLYFDKYKPSSQTLTSLEIFLKNHKKNVFSPLSLLEQNRGKNKPYVSMSFFLASYVENFFTDENFSCRRPFSYTLINRFFSEQEGDSFSAPFPPCSRRKFVIYDQEGAPLEIDLDRVYEVHYYLASKGKGFISSFGHSMIRISMCKEGSPRNKDCLENFTEDVVFSFRAFVNGIVLETLAGLGIGKKSYPSQLMAYTTASLIEEYNLKSQRDLMSYPLKMNSEQVQDFVKASLETYWAYQGKYSFLFNNCATETGKLFNVVFPDKKFSVTHKNQSYSRHQGTNRNSQSQNSSYPSIMPFGILDNLKQVGVVEKKVSPFRMNSYSGDLNKCISDLYENKIFGSVSEKNKHNIKSYGVLDFSERFDIFVTVLTAPLSHHRKMSLMKCMRGLENFYRNSVVEGGYNKILDSFLVDLGEKEISSFESIYIPVSRDEKGGFVEISLGKWIQTYTSYKKMILTPSHFIKNIYQDSSYGIPLGDEFDQVKFNSIVVSLDVQRGEIENFLEYLAEAIEGSSLEEIESFLIEKNYPVKLTSVVAAYKRFLELDKNISEMNHVINDCQSEQICNQLSSKILEDASSSL